MVRIYLNIKEMGNVLDNIDTLGEKIVNNVSNDLSANIKRESPIDEGKLRSSWTIFDNGPLEKTVASSANYAEYVNSGTGIYGPHKTPIVHPTIGKKFAFQVNGKMVYTNIIKGIKPRRFVEKSISQTEKRIPELVIHSINQIKLGN